MQFSLCWSHSLLFSFTLYFFFNLPEKDIESKRAKMRQKSKELHELPNTENVKSGTNRLASDLCYLILAASGEGKSVESAN